MRSSTRASGHAARRHPAVCNLTSFALGSSAHLPDPRQALKVPQVAHPAASQVPTKGVARPCKPVVSLAQALDLPYVVHLQKRFGDVLGFIPRLALAEKIDLRRIWLVNENEDPAGFLHHGTLATPEVRIFQAAVQYDAQRRHLGLSLVQSFVDRAKSAGAQAVSLRCLSELDANEFWQAAGFERISSEAGARGTLNVWGRRLGSGPFHFHSRVHACPKCGAPTMDTWTRGAVRRPICPQCVAREG